MKSDYEEARLRFTLALLEARGLLEYEHVGDWGAEIFSESGHQPTLLGRTKQAFAEGRRLADIFLVHGPNAP